MSISVTISGQDSVSVVSAQPLSSTVGVSSSAAVNILNTATGVLRNDISNVSGLITSNDSSINSLNTATGVLNTSVLELQTATGLLQTATGVLETVTGFFAQTGSRPIIFAQDISTIGGTISADQGTFTEVRGTIKTPSQLDIKTLSLQNLSVTGGNFVGIGTASPNAELDVSGELRVNGPLNLIESHAYKISNQEWARLKNNSIQIGDLGGNNFSTAIFGNGGHQVITITGDTSSATNTFVGIGTTSPQSKLHVNGNTILSGNLGVGTTPSTKLHVDGNITGAHISGKFLSATGGISVGINRPVVGGQHNPTFAVKGDSTFNGDVSVKKGNEEHLDIDTTLYSYKLGDISGGENQSFLEINSTAQFATLHNSPLKITDKFECKDLVASGFTTLSGGAFITGMVGIGTSVLFNPDAQLYVKSTGDTVLKLEADSNNSKESFNPLIQLLQDGGLVSANIGLNGDAGAEYTGALSNAFYIETTPSVGGFGAFQIATNNNASFTIDNNSNIGIGTHVPAAKLHVIGDTILSGALTVSGNIDSPSITSLNTATGLLVQKSETGVLLTSGEIQTNIDTAVANLVDSAPGTLNTLNELAAALGDDANFSTTTATSLGNLSTATGVLNTNVTALQAVSGSFARTGSGNFGLLNVTGKTTLLQDVGIGTDLPLNKLHVVETSAGGVTYPIRIQNDDASNNAGVGIEFGISTNDNYTNARIQATREDTAASAELAFQTRVDSSQVLTERMRIDRTGRVGIGTNSPQAKLHVDGNTILSGVLAVTGKVGIGTDSPSQTLDILGDGFAGFRIEEGITNKSFLFQFHQTQGRLNLTTDGDAPINLRASNSDTNLLINTNGNVGIGTGTPLQKLHVNGNSIISGNLGIGTSNPTKKLEVVGGPINSLGGGLITGRLGVGTNSTGLAALTVDAGGTNSVARFVSSDDKAIIQLVDDDTDAHLIAKNSKFCIGSNTNDINKFNVDITNGNTFISGDLGIGTVSPAVSLHVEEGIILASGSSTSHGFELRRNPFDTFQIKHLDGNFTINNLTDDRKDLSIDGNGNVGIGTTAPQEKLHVAGDTLLSGVTTVVNNLQLSGNVKDLDGDDLLQFSANDLIVGHKHIQAGFGVGVRNNRGDTKGMDQGSTSSNLGLFCNSIEALSIQTDGDVIVNTGNLGIGTTSPESLLTIRDEVGGKSLLIEGAGGNNVAVLGTVSGFANRAELLLKDGAGAADVIKLSSRSSINNFVHNGGNFGIGTVSPQAKLHVNGDTILSGNLTITGTSLVAKNLNVEGTIISESGRIILHDTTIDGDKVIAAAGNNLRFFSVHGVFGNTVGIQDNRGSVKGMSPGSTSSDLGLFCNSIEGISIQNDGDVIVGNGNLGVGTTTPATKLHVNGNITGSIISGGYLFTTGGIGIGLPRPSVGGSVTDKFAVNGSTTLNGTTVLNGDVSVKNGNEGHLDVQTTNYIYKFGDISGGETQNHLEINSADGYVKFLNPGAVGINAEPVGTTNKLQVFGPTFLSGNVGIGTTAPNEKLHVQDSSSSSGTALTIQNTFGESPKNIKFKYADNVETARIEGFGRNNTSVRPYLAFHVNQTTSSSASNNVAEIMRITSSGNVGIGTTAPTEALDVNGNILSNGIIKAFNTTQNAAQLQVGRGNAEFIEAKVSDLNCILTAKQDGDSNGDHHFILDRDFNGTGPNDFEIRKSGVAQVTVNKDGNLGIGTTAPAAKLHVNGDTILSGNLDISGSITPAKDVAFDIGSPTKRFKDLYLSGDSIFLGETRLSISGDELQTRKNGVVRRAPLRDNLNQTRNLIVTGNAVLGKCSLSANSFVTETGDFTLGLNHRGATVLLQNPAAITITCPALVPGHVTTFIAETQHIASFATGVGMSGLNSFNGASEMAGIFAQAQIIYKSLSGAFLGGNII